MRKFLFLSLLWFPLAGMGQVAFSFSDPPAKAELLPASFINTAMSERDFALSPDGNECYFTLQVPRGFFQTIVYCRKDKKGVWSKPEVAPFAGRYIDLEPAFAPGGDKLFFSSNRPVEGKTSRDFDIWMTEKKNGRWQEPVHLGKKVNTSADEFYPSVTSEGHLYFTAAYPHGMGKEDIYRSRFSAGEYQTPELVDSTVNTKGYEFNAFVSPDEKYLFFTAYGRKEEMGRGDLYMSAKDSRGKWLPAKNLSFINSDQLDYCPFVSFDGKTFFFTSERHSLSSVYDKAPVTYAELKKQLNAPLNTGGNIFWISFDSVLEWFESH